MNRKFRHLLTLLFVTGISLSAAAFNPKSKPGANDKSGDATSGGGNDVTNVKLPVGFPFQLTDTPSSSDANENGGVVSDPAQIVYTFDLPDGVGPESVHETHSAFQQARSMNAACVLIHMNSFSNALDAAENIGNEILDYDRPVMVYVNNRAIPANTLIHMAADKKSMNNHGNANSKTVKRQLKTEQGNSDESASYFHQKNSANQNADDDVSCTSVMNFQNRFLNTQSANLDDVLAQAGMEKFKVVHYSAGFFSQLIDLCMKPFMSLFFILLIAIGMRLQVKSVFPGPATFLLMVSLPLFAVPLIMGGLASAVELLAAFLLCITLIISTRRKTTSFSFNVLTGILFILALTICQSSNASASFDLRALLITFFFSSVVFFAGWFIPVLFSKFLSREQQNETSIALSHVS